MIEKPTLDELIHSGVKGMKWGVRKAEQPANARYSDAARAKDKKDHGTRGVKRINKRLNEGQTLKKARSREVRRDTLQGVAAVGAYYAASAVRLYGPILAQTIAVRAETNRGRANVAANRGLPRSAAGGPTYSKQNRNGVYNVTTV